MHGWGFDLYHLSVVQLIIEEKLTQNYSVDTLLDTV